MSSPLSLDSQLERAFELGERNQQTLTLVENWCAHARLERYGSGGLAEAMSGNPIGVMGMGCDYAPVGGLYGWDLAVAALDFHDRNCAGCTHREAVGLPNLTTLLVERTAVLQDATIRENAAETAGRAAHAARQAVRDRLRMGLSPVSATIVDELSTLDGCWDRKTEEALVATAKLAPEAFTPPIIEHLFSLVEGASQWAPDVVLRILLELSVDPARLARASVRVLAKGGSATAARAATATLDHIAPDAVEAVLPELIELAEPLDLPFPVASEKYQPDALRALHAKHPAAVEGRLATLLVQPDIDSLNLGARGAKVIADHDPVAAGRLARGAISAMVRGKALEEAYGASGQATHALRETIARAYEADPEGVEALMQSYLVGGLPVGQGRLFTVYREILDRSFDGAPIEPTAAHTVAFRRLLQAATESHPPEVESEIQSVFRSSPRDLIRLATQNVDALLGAALVLDDRVKRLDAESEAPGPLLSRLERNRRRDGAHQLQKSLVTWAAYGAAGDLQVIRQFFLLLDALPEDRDHLRAVMVGRFKTLATSPETFAEVLPPLYGALVGASTLVRGAAAKVVGELPRRLLSDAPSLLLEALVALLNDPYQLVLSNTVKALERLTLPEPYHAQVRGRLVQVVSAYAQTRDRVDFLVECTSLFVHRYLTEAERAGRAGAWIVQTLANHPPRSFAKELPSLGRDLGTVPAFGQLVLAALQDSETMHLHGDDVVRALRDLGPAAIAQIRDPLMEVGKAAPAVEVEFRLGPLHVEVFSAVGDWTAAQVIADSAVEKVGDTRRELTQKLAAKLVQAATAFERALAEGRSEDAESIGGEWRALRAELQAAIA